VFGNKTWIELMGGASIIGLSFYISITGYDFMDMLRARASEKPVFNKA
jgi:hypothetical protein